MAVSLPSFGIIACPFVEATSRGASCPVTEFVIGVRVRFLIAWELMGAMYMTEMKANRRIKRSATRRLGVDTAGMMKIRRLEVDIDG